MTKLAYEKGLPWLAFSKRTTSTPQGVPDEPSQDLALRPNCKTPISPLQALSGLFWEDFIWQSLNSGE